MEKKQIAIIGHNRVPLYVVEKLESEGYEIVESPEGIEIPEQGRPLDFHFNEYVNVYERLGDIPSMYPPTTSKADLKRCKKGIHNYEVIEEVKEYSGGTIVNGKRVCIHCKKEI